MPVPAYEPLKISADGATGFFIGLFVLSIFYMGLSQILAIKSPDAIGRSFKKEE